MNLTSICVALEETARRLRTQSLAGLAAIATCSAAAASDCTDYQIWDDSGGFIPAAFTHALGPDYVVALRHGDIRYLTRGGEVVFDQRLNAPTGIFPGSGDLYEPKAVFDPDSRRFVITGGDTYGSADGGDSSPGTYIGIAASDDDDPHGDWVGRYINISPLLAPYYYASYPSNMQLGFDEEAFYVPWDNFAGNPYDDSSWMLIFDRAALLAGDPPLASVFLTSELPVAFAAAKTFDVDAPAQYLATTFGSLIGESKLQLMAIRDPLSSPTTDVHFLELPEFDHGPFIIPSLDIPDGINSNDSRVHRAVYRDGSLWVTHHGRPVGESRALAIWYEIDMNGWPVSGELPEIVQHGVLDPGPHVHTWNPDLAVDAQGNVAFAYCRSAADEMHAVGSAYRLVGDPAGTTQGHAIVKEGEIGATLPGTKNYSLYSSAAEDPDVAGVFSAGGAYRRENQWGGVSTSMWGGDVCLTLALPGDLNGDGCVDQADLGELLGDWNCSGGDCPGDIDGDGDTDQADLGELLAEYGEGC